ncbi:MAG: hypothetical protein JNL69_08675 [Bacteroidia bacterium]|nr:hypothetical protein [Bacteroidia bacterium]
MIYFSETQKFKQWWIWLIFLLPLIAIVDSYPNNGFDMDTLWGSGIGISIVALIALLLFSLKLKTEITDIGIGYKFNLFHTKMNVIKWEDISECFVREYKPLWEYGGWGLRYTIRNGKAFNTMGNKGLQIILKDGSKVLVGTQKSEDIETVLVQLKNLNIIK